MFLSSYCKILMGMFGINTHVFIKFILSLYLGGCYKNYEISRMIHVVTCDFRGYLIKIYLNDNFIMNDAKINIDLGEFLELSEDSLKIIFKNMLLEDVFIVFSYI